MRMKRAMALVAILIAIAVVSFLVYRRANRLRTDSPTGVADSGTPAAPAGEGGLGTSVFTDAAPKPRSASPTAPKTNPDAAVPRVNPYAVIRSGICVPSNAPGQEKASRKKWEELLRDPYWQSVFSGVNPDRFHLVQTSLALQRYVNYWKMENGQVIHWTGKKISIPSGTRVFTDGQGAMYLCACGNQVAAVLPPGKSGTVLPAEDEPPTAYLVPPEPEPYPDIPGELSGETLTLMAPPEVATTLPDNESELIPPIPPIPPIFVGGPLPLSSGPGPIPGPPSEPPATPEPDTLSLILIGLGASIVAGRHRKRR
jgi:hypothetical protein